MDIKWFDSPQSSDPIAWERELIYDYVWYILQTCDINISWGNFLVSAFKATFTGLGDNSGTALFLMLAFLTNLSEVLYDVVHCNHLQRTE